MWSRTHFNTYTPLKKKMSAPYNESVFATGGFDAAMCVVLSIDCEEMVGDDLRKIKTWAPWQPLGDLNLYRPLSALARMVEAMTALHGADGVESRLCFFSCALRWEETGDITHVLLATSIAEASSVKRGKTALERFVTHVANRTLERKRRQSDRFAGEGDFVQRTVMGLQERVIEEYSTQPGGPSTGDAVVALGTAASIVGELNKKKKK